MSSWSPIQRRELFFQVKVSCSEGPALVVSSSTIAEVKSIELVPELFCSKKAKVTMLETSILYRDSVIFRDHDPKIGSVINPWFTLVSLSSQEPRAIRIKKDIKCVNLFQAWLQ